MPKIQADALRDFATALLSAGGFTQSDARQTAELLVWANLRGIESHGVLRIPRYVEMIDQGIIVSGTEIETVRETGAVVLLDGGKCPGAVGMMTAVEKAALLADTHGIGWCSVRAISHCGAIGYYTSALTEKGLVGIAMSASKPLMSYVGAKGEALSTNPLSIAIPNGQKEPLILDMSTAAVALGKIMAAKDRGEQIPEGWAIDADGKPATDPQKVEAVLPMAGAKGSGLSLMIEILTSVLAGNAVIGPVLHGRKKGGFNGLVMAIDPGVFGEAEAFADDVDDLVHAIHALEPTEAGQPVLLPGERSARTEKERSQSGIPLADGTMARLKALANEKSVPIPEALG